MDDTTLDSCRRMHDAARRKLDVARSLQSSGYYNDSLSRAYYAAFHSASMLLYAHGQSYSRHSQLIGAFNRDFVATGKLPKDVGKALGRFYGQRQVADYDIFERADEKEAAQGIQDAESIIEAVRLLVERSFSVRILEENKDKNDDPNSMPGNC